MRLINNIFKIKMLNNNNSLFLLVLFLFELTIITNQQFMYKGCFNDTLNRDLNSISMKNTTNMSIKVCIDFCFENLLPYAGLQRG